MSVIRQALRARSATARPAGLVRRPRGVVELFYSSLKVPPTQVTCLILEETTEPSLTEFVSLTPDPGEPFE